MGSTVSTLSAIGSAASGGSSLFNSVAQIRTNSYNAHLQEEQNALNRAWQTEEAEKARLYNTQERIASQDFAVDMINRQNQYNLPVNQAARLRDAGLNPTIAMGNTGTQSVSASSSPSSPASSPMPAQVAGISPVAQPPYLDVTKLSSFIKDLASASKDSAEARELISTLIPKIRTAIANADQAEINTNLLKMHESLQKSSLPWKVKSAEMDYYNLVMDYNLKEEKVLTEQEEQNLKRVTQKLNESLASLHGKEAEKIGKELPFITQFISSQILSNRASARASNTQAGLNVKMGSYYDQLSRGERFWNDLNQQERESLTSKLIDECNAAGLANKVSKEKFELFKQLAKKFENENDWFIANQILDRMQQIAGDIIDLKNVKIKQDDISGKYGDTYEDHYSAYDDQGRKHTYTKKYNRSGQKYKGKY